MEINTDHVESFRALALQVTCHAVNHVQNRAEARSQNALYCAIALQRKMNQTLFIISITRTP
ncbi:MAG: hypothetical protein QNJ18_11480 [Xenococcaceae cyanobacterium MO_167.B52]|nr:hypothetical protein [Xenococcaceae cyanobacterium MO_167.B52]